MKIRGKIGALLLAACLAAGALAGCGSSSETVQKTPMGQLGDDTIYLEEAVFYTRMLQEQWENSYYDDMGETMWQEEFDSEGRTFEEVLKQDVEDTLTEIHLLCAHAEEYDVELTEDEKEQVAQRAQNFMETNTPSVLEAAGATAELVEELLQRNALAAKVAEAIQDSYEPDLDPESATVGKMTYCLFSTMGTYDAEGNHSPATEEELVQIQKDAAAFAQRARELGDIAAAGDEISHTVIDVYYNEETDGGAHPLVAQAARELEAGQVSDVIETEDGYYIVQHISDYDEKSSEDYYEELKEQARASYLEELEAAWKEETPLVINSDAWDGIRVDQILINQM